MRDTTIFVGDVHGNLAALQGMLDTLNQYQELRVIFLGDYINKGPHSAQVVELLLNIHDEPQITLLAGNHEKALLGALKENTLTAFLKMGGAMTIRSYVGGNVEGDVLHSFREHLPLDHIEMLRDMPETWESDQVIATHIPQRRTENKFSVSAHVPIGLIPRIDSRTAQLDTGCGSSDGRLTALLWPSLHYLQVDAEGELLPEQRQLA